MEQMPEPGTYQVYFDDYDFDYDFDDYVLNDFDYDFHDFDDYVLNDFDYDFDDFEPDLMDIDFDDFDYHDYDFDNFEPEYDCDDYDFDDFETEDDCDDYDFDDFEPEYDCDDYNFDDFEIQDDCDDYDFDDFDYHDYDFDDFEPEYDCDDYDFDYHDYDFDDFEPEYDCDDYNFDDFEIQDGCDDYDFDDFDYHDYDFDDFEPEYDCDDYNFDDFEIQDDCDDYDFDAFDYHDYDFDDFEPEYDFEYFDYNDYDFDDFESRDFSFPWNIHPRKPSPKPYQIKPSPETYQIFISHRGPDAKLTHASLIYHSLRQCGLRVFLDQKEFRKGDTLWPAIIGAILSASVHIIIFSTNYAESRWCLDELCWILNSVHERNATMVPMFCDVEPGNLRDITRGPYAAHFDKHRRKGRVTMEWEKALKEAADFSGIMVQTNQSDYGIYLEQLVSTVLTEVKRKEPLEVATHPVGLDEAAMDFDNKIGYQRKSKETKIVGIVGMAGLGKSTLVKHLYNVKRFDFTRSSILLNVRGRDLASFQEQLIRDLLMDHGLHIDNPVQGKDILQRRLPGLQALIVLDDVDDAEKIDSLLDMNAVGSGSLILLTSRDKDLLRRSSPKTVLYDVEPLNRKHAQELFCHHAFLLPKPVQRFEDLVGEFLKICGGLPSSLKALGRHLAGNDDKTFWKLQVEKFSKRLPDDIINTLKVSYEALSKEKKEMFLDIGCFLVGEDRELAVRVLEGLGYSDVRDCLESIRQKCLVEYNYDVKSNNYINYKYEQSRVIMHIQVKGLARHIAREEFFEFANHKPLRLSCSSDIEEMFQLQDGSDSCLTRGIRIPKGENPPQLSNDINIRGVRLLVVEHPMDLSSFAMSGKLVWLRFNSFPSISIPSTISLARLRVLELHTPGDHLQQLFDRFNELSCELRKLTSNASGTASAGASSSREPFDVEHYMNFCRNICSFQQGGMTSFSGFPQSFPIHFGELKNLRHLDLSGCTNLTELPNSFSELLHLQHVALQYCINLSIPMDILGEISTLEYVDFKGCAKLVHLPEGMANQRSLTYLDLKFCFELKTLPDLSNLVNLKFLNIDGCVKLETPNLECLRSLDISKRRP